MKPTLFPFMGKIKYFGKDKKNYFLKGVADVQMVSWKKENRGNETT